MSNNDSSTEITVTVSGGCIARRWALTSLINDAIKNDVECVSVEGVNLDSRYPVPQTFTSDLRVTVKVVND